jgi:hypothetical protein
MRRLLICTGFLSVFLIASVLAGPDPNQPEMNIEDRLTSLENQIELLEERIELLESQQQTEKTPERAEEDESEPDRDALRIERAKEQIEAALYEIEIIETHIESLPLNYSSKEDRLTDLRKKAGLYADMERNLSRIIYIAERNPEVEIDILPLQKQLINCRAEKKKAYDDQESLQEQIREDKRYLRY